MNLLHDIVALGLKLAAAGAEGDFEVQLPKAAIDLIKSEASTMQRFNCTATAEGVLAMWGPAGVIVIRERTPPEAVERPGTLHSLEGVPTLRQAVLSGDLKLIAQSKFARDPKDCPHTQTLSFEYQGVLHSFCCRDCGADLMATMQRRG